MIILNEYKYALKILEEHIVGNKPSETLSILARYYRHKIDKKDKEISNLLNQHMMNFYPNYNPVKWTKTIDSQVRKSKKYPLIEIDYVPITEAELVVIDSLEGVRMQRLAFTLLACAKFCNMRNEKNNGWVNRECKEIFKLANITQTIKEQCEMIYKLKTMGLVSLSKKVDNTNLKVEFINNDSDVVLKIDDFRELGLEYMVYKGSKLIRCQKCGKLISSCSTSRKYCNDCAGYQTKEYKVVICCDCGKEFVASAKNNKSIRCEQCQSIFDKNTTKQRVRKYRENHSA